MIKKYNNFLYLVGFKTDKNGFQVCFVFLLTKSSVYLNQNSSNLLGKKTDLKT